MLEALDDPFGEAAAEAPSPPPMDDAIYSPICHFVNGVEPAIILSKLGNKQILEHRLTGESVEFVIGDGPPSQAQIRAWLWLYRPRRPAISVGEQYLQEYCLDAKREVGRQDGGRGL